MNVVLNTLPAGLSSRQSVAPGFQIKRGTADAKGGGRMGEIPFVLIQSLPQGGEFRILQGS